MPVYNGVGTVARAITSLKRQGLTAWELLAVDDGSTDGSLELLEALGKADRRIRVLRTDENLGASAARNVGLRSATGQMIAYLDCDDEFYPEYLDNVDRLGAKGDVLVFGYDYVDERIGPAAPVRTWDPTPYRHLLFMRNFATPLGIAHRRGLNLQGFDEDLWCLEDWDLWKRLARAGAEFLFLPMRSGLYHIRPGSLSRAPRITARQRSAYTSRYVAGGPFFDVPTGSGRRRVEKILLASSQCLLSGTAESSAATATLQLLSEHGLTCQGFCPGYTGSGGKAGLEQTLKGLSLPYQVRNTSLGPFSAEILFSLLGRIPVTFFPGLATAERAEANDRSVAFLTYFEQQLNAFQPDVLLIHGGGQITDHMISLAKRRDVTVVFGLYSIGFTQQGMFRNVDYCLTPSEFVRGHYWSALGLHCQTLPCPDDPKTILTTVRAPRYVTFVDRRAASDLPFFARIVEQVGIDRPEIPFLLIRDRLDVSWRTVSDDLRSIGPTNLVESEDHSFLHCYSCSKVILSPSLDSPPFDPLISGAMTNGIPVLVGDRGSLPELVDDPESVIPLPNRLAPNSASMPTEEEVSEWVRRIVRLWDDEEFYRRARVRSRQAARRWHPEVLGPRLEEFFRGLTPQPGPPLVPQPISGEDRSPADSPVVSRSLGTPNTPVEEMVGLIRDSPPGRRPTGWAHWDNVKMAHRRMADDFLEALPDYPGGYDGRGIVIAGGGATYFTCAWVCIRMLRRLGCELPIQLWYIGDGEMDSRMERLVRPFGVECVDARRVAVTNPCRTLSGWGLKPYMMKYSPYREVLLLDADNVPVQDPTSLFESPEYQRHGAVLWPDFYQRGSPDVRHDLSPAVWETFGIPPRDEPTTESGQVLIDKQRCWRELSLALWYTEYSDWSFEHVYGDKECFHLGWRKCGSDYAITSTPPIWTGHTILQHDFQGRRLFQHRCRDKWRLDGRNRLDPSWQDEEVCIDFLTELSRVWDGDVKAGPRLLSRSTPLRSPMATTGDGP